MLSAGIQTHASMGDHTEVMLVMMMERAHVNVCCDSLVDDDNDHDDENDIACDAVCIDVADGDDVSRRL